MYKVKVNFDEFGKLIRDFLTENLNKPSLQSYVENLTKIVEGMKPHSSKEVRYYEMARHNLREIRNGIKRLEEEKNTLAEQLKLLEEEKVAKLSGRKK
jgi:hypothetical protein